MTRYYDSMRQCVKNLIILCKCFLDCGYSKLTLHSRMGFDFKIWLIYLCIHLLQTYEHSSREMKKCTGRYLHMRAYIISSLCTFTNCVFSFKDYKITIWEGHSTNSKIMKDDLRANVCSVFVTMDINIISSRTRNTPILRGCITRISGNYIAP